jgi:hypothetical protein
MGDTKPAWFSNDSVCALAVEVAASSINASNGRAATSLSALRRMIVKI